MKLTLDKSVTIMWPKNNEKDQYNIYYFTAGKESADLPDDVAQYVLEKYKDHIIDIKDSVKEEKKSIEEVIKEVKEKAPEKKKEFENKKITEEKSKNRGIRLEDLAKQA